MKDAIVNYLDGVFPPEIVTLIIAATPVLELRGALPVALKMFNFTPFKAFILSIVGNLAPVVPLLFFLNYASHLLMRFPAAKKFFDWWFARTRRHSKIVEKYETLGLLLFVAVPLPMTGAWSGCVAAYLLGIKFRHAVSAIAAGVVIAGIIVSTTVLGVSWIF